ncbi:nicotinate-nucleotide--dimethylbenzimidazole phosphoribosyltransferase [Corynebacterium lipophiloflavum]|uniref:Nicotinate-nucleotide--dimethylbenzimidazole phosphoribosyltransferase n=1 Tax=Corynebacterium lipophiloflavum (strain ATCC 700352 / DSM 44291 / CCUG 37336 / JCM 10383 / DMMZ 1944) TaxID=525263 RepID=C0XRX1_CORLD|nr:nicotinate-nucleotide--dimethylbenzimidazole phosphoribosyltransferase [Corynebacterium lipophiloflavum]EEI17062.1 putative nicotinate-nucleotide--dimethylbenzimidazole phosphoribosyltransferase [Corynebacterium lipophiloflavum DSM 44291]
MFATVDIPDEAAGARVRERLAASVRGRSLGRLGDIAAWVASVTASSTPEPFDRARAIVIAGNHAVAQRGVSAFMPEATAVQVEEIRAGGGPANTAARIAGCTLRLVDDFADAPHGSIDIEDAMSQEVFDQALALGTQIADNEVDAGTDLIIPGDLGVGNTTVAAAVFGALTGTEPAVAIGRGSGINDEVWKVKVVAVRDAMFRVRGFRDDVPAVLRAISGPDFVTLVALIAQAAVRRTPVLIDGAYVAVAAFVAEKLAPGTKRWLIAGQLSPEPCHAVCVQALELTPVLALDMSTGQAAGALLALPVINGAAELAGEELRSHEG